MAEFELNFKTPLNLRFNSILGQPTKPLVEPLKLNITSKAQISCVEKDEKKNNILTDFDTFHDLLSKYYPDVNVGEIANSILELFECRKIRDSDKEWIQLSEVWDTICRKDSKQPAETSISYIFKKFSERESFKEPTIDHVPLPIGLMGLTPRQLPNSSVHLTLYVLGLYIEQMLGMDLLDAKMTTRWGAAPVSLSAITPLLFKYYDIEKHTSSATPVEKFVVFALKSLEDYKEVRPMIITAKTKIASKLKRLFSSFHMYKNTNTFTAFTWMFTMHSRGIIVHVDHFTDNKDCVCVTGLPSVQNSKPTRCLPIHTDDLVAYIKFRQRAMTRQKRNVEVEREMQNYKNEIPKWITNIGVPS